MCTSYQDRVPLVEQSSGTYTVRGTSLISAGGASCKYIMARETLGGLHGVNRILLVCRSRKMGSCYVSWICISGVVLLNVQYGTCYITMRGYLHSWRGKLLSGSYPTLHSWD